MDKKEARQTAWQQCPVAVTVIAIGTSIAHFPALLSAMESGMELAIQIYFLAMALHALGIISTIIFRPSHFWGFLITNICILLIGLLYFPLLVAMSIGV